MACSNARALAILIKVIPKTLVANIFGEWRVVSLNTLLRYLQMNSFFTVEELFILVISTDDSFSVLINF